MIGDPATAPRRTDLGFLTTRSRPRAAATPAEPTSTVTTTTTGGGVDYVRRAPRANSTGTPANTGSGIDYTHPERRDPDPTPPTPAPAPSQPTPTPAGAANPLDLSRPTPATPTPPTPNQPATNPLDLATPAPGAHPAAPSPVAEPGDNLLDLSGGSPSVPDQPNTSTPPKNAAAQPPSIHPVRRLAGDDRELLSPTRPTLALTRVQSGVGGIDIELHAPTVPSLALACVVTDAEGESRVVDPTHPHSPPPPSNTDPLVTFSSNGFGKFGINLRRARELSRLIVVATSATGEVIDWTGTLSLTTFGGGRVDIPIDATPQSPTTIIASIYNVAGEYVLRAENQPMGGSLREASRSFGFDSISWLDARTPIS
ncbi:hypothetical protein [Gordonia sp. CPCC 205333]|uniref:hypothetical protein n=1 Tax=Gordonia sp. CPCC 205333 TaxID=3140790 RepID=UPI003AF33F64